MANVKNFGLVGVGSDLQFGKAGTRLVNNAGTFNFKAADGSSDAAITLAGITSSAGNVTLTTGNLALTATDGTVSIGTDTTLSRQQAGVFQFNGTKAFIAPVGNTAARPGTPVEGMIRVNSDVVGAGTVEFHNGTAWTTLATGGATGTIQTEIDNIEDTLGTMVNTNGTTNVAATLTNALFGSATDLTTALQNLASGVNAKDTLDEILPGTDGQIIYNVSGVWTLGVPGATSKVQAYDAGLAALAVKTSTGIMVQTGNDTFTSVSLTAPAAGITISNADGTGGSPTFALADDLAALEALASTGFAVRTAANTWAQRSITGTATRVVVTNGDGVLASPTIDLATVTDLGTGTFLKFTRDAYGRVEGTTAVVAGDITALVDATYVNVSGDSMASAANLTFVGGGQVLGLPAIPVGDTAAASKAYVDSVASGLNIHAAVEAKTGTQAVDTQFVGAVYSNGTLGVGATVTAAANGVLGTVGGYAALTVGARVLVDTFTGTSWATNGDAADSKANGVYVVTSLGSAGTTWVLTRASDFNNSIAGQVQAGDYVYVQEGSFGATGWVESAIGTGTADAIIFGTDPVLFTQFSGAGAYTAGTGLTLSAGQFSVNLGAGITQLDTNNVGIDLYSGSSGGLILTTDGSTRSTGNATKLSLLTGAGLTQDATGLYIAANQITNAMILNDFITFDTDTGTSPDVALGATVSIFGDGVALSTAVSGSAITISARDAEATGTKGVASFNTAFTVTAGDVALNTVTTALGGTGLTSFVANEVFYAGTTSTMDQSANFTFNGTSTMTVGGALPLAINGALGSISATATNSDLILMPNGSGSVIVGPVGAGLIQSDAGTALTVRGNTTLTLASGTGSTTMQLASGTTAKVSISGTSAVNYATSLAANDLTNKQYVDTAIASGASAGAVKSFQATVPLNANGTTNIGTAMPAGATVLSVKVRVDTVDAAATLSVGKAGSVSAYMTTGENDTQTQGLYMAECFVTETLTQTLIATVAATAATSGSTCVVIVTYQVAQ